MIRNVLKEGTLSESAIHKTIIEWVRLHPHLSKYIFHVANEGKRTPNYMRFLYALGFRKGVSDLHIALQRHGYGAAWIEIKSKTGKLSKEQKEFLEDMEQQGYFTSVVWSVDEGIDIIKWYCFES